MKLIKLMLVAICLMLGSQSANAVPACRMANVYSQPDGSLITLRLVGDEYFHYYLTDDDQMVLSSKGAYYFAQPDATGRPVPSQVLAADPDKRTADQRSFVTLVDRAALFGGAVEQANVTRSARFISQPSPFRAPAKSASSSDWASKGIGLFPNNAFPITGSPHLCVILVQFSDVSFTMSDPYSYFNNMANQEGFNDKGSNFNSYSNATGSARDFFFDNSKGVFIPIFDVYGPVTLSNTMAYYGGNDSSGNDLRPEYMIRDAVKALDGSVDFSVYDADNDGYLDMVYVIYAGWGEASGGPEDNIWPHSWNVQKGGGLTYRADGKILDKYACSAEILSKSGNNYLADGIGTFCHEFSHVLGLADEYDTSYGTAYDNSLTPGDYSLMDGGSYNNNGRTPPTYSIFQRNALGWADIEVLKPGVGRNIEMGHILDTNLGYAIETKDNGGSKNEFILLENRQKTKWDSALPGHGMLIWHITYDATTWNSNKPNNSATLQRINLVSANNAPATAAGRPFPGTSNVKSFNPSTTNGVSLNLPLSSISENTSVKKVSFLVCGGEVEMPILKIDGVEVTSDEISHVGPAELTLTPGASGTTPYYLYMTDNDIIDEAPYSGPISVTEDMEFEYWAVRNADNIVSRTGAIKIHITPEDIDPSLETVATPSFSHESGEVEAGSTVSISCATLGATIYYTLDGTAPTVNSSLYTSPIVINEAKTIKAIAVKNGMNKSSIASASYTIHSTSKTFNFYQIWNYNSGWSNSYSLHTLEYDEATISMTASKQASTITDYPVTKGSDLTIVMKEGYRPISEISLKCQKWSLKAQTITLKYSTDGTNFKILDPSVTSSNFEISSDNLPEGTIACRFEFSNSSNQVGLQEVTVKYAEGGNNDPDPQLETVATPTISPAAGELNYGSTVSIACATEGATIHYTTDGSTPTATSATYSLPIVVKNAMTVKAIAVKEGWLDSEIASAVYTVRKETVATPTFSPASGELESGSEVSINCTTEGATIHYTTDGSTPTATSATYSTPIIVRDAMTIKAIAIKEGWIDSEVAVSTYTVGSSDPDNPQTELKTVKFNLYHAWGNENWGNSYVDHTLEWDEATISMNASKQTSTITDYPVTKGSQVTVIMKDGYRPIRKVSFSCEKWGSKAQTITLNYSTDGVNFSQLSPNITSSNFSLTCDDLPEGTIAVRFIFSSQSNQVGLKDVTVTYCSTTDEPEPQPETVATPMFTPDGGEVEAGATVSISCATEGATIHYTTDNSTPTRACAVYTSPITITEGVTVKAIAVKEGWNDSDVSSATFTIKQNEPDDPNDPEIECNYDEYTFDFTGESAYGMTLLSGTTSSYNPEVYTCYGENINITLGGQTRWWQASGGNELRFYAGSHFTLEAADGYHIINVTSDAKSSDWDEISFNGFSQDVDFNCIIEKKNTALTYVNAKIVQVPSFLIDNISGGSDDNGFILKCRFGHINSKHVNKYVLWVVEAESSTGAQLRALGEEPVIGKLEIDPKECPDGVYELSIPLSIEPESGIHNLALRGHALLPGENVVYHMHWDENNDVKGSTGNEFIGFDTSNGGTTSLDRLTIDNNEVKYYNLQGVRLAAPIRGQYLIRVTPDGQAKVILIK